MIDFYTDFPPTINSYYVKARNGVFISKKGRKFREQLDKDVHEQIGAREAIGERITLTVILAMPDKRTRDIDNYMKPLLDAITHSGLWEDDELVDQLFIYRAKIVKEGKVYIRIEEGLPVLTLERLTSIID